jgi:hypothetical protein
MQAPKQEALDLPTLTAYITYARQHVHPTLSSEAADDLVNGYVTMRRKGNFPGSSKKVCQICLIYHLTFEYTSLQESIPFKNISSVFCWARQLRTVAPI